MKKLTLMNTLYLAAIVGVSLNGLRIYADVFHNNDVQWKKNYDKEIADPNSRLNQEKILLEDEKTDKSEVLSNLAETLGDDIFEKKFVKVNRKEVSGQVVVSFESCLIYLPIHCSPIGKPEGYSRLELRLYRMELSQPFMEQTIKTFFWLFVDMTKLLDESMNARNKGTQFNPPFFNARRKSISNSILNDAETIVYSPLYGNMEEFQAVLAEVLFGFEEYSKLKQNGNNLQEVTKPVKQKTE